MHLVLDVPLTHSFKTPKRKMDDRAPPIGRWAQLVSPSFLADLLHSGNLDRTLIIDSRSFLEYNTSHIRSSVNIGCSKIVKRRLEQNKLSIQELLSNSCHSDKPSSACDVIVYDQSTQDLSRLCPDSFIVVLLSKLAEAFKTVSMLSGGFTAFKTAFPYLCETQGQPPCTMLGPSLSQPCLPVTKVGPTRVLNYLYIGSQQDVLDEATMRANGINYVLNVSKTCPSPTHIAPGHFHRIPVRDNYGEKLLPWFEDAMDFIEKVRSANGCVIVHCLAGISRSPTVAIAYIMKHMNLGVDDAYRYVKDKRQSISPNFNFLGQLLEFEKSLNKDNPPTASPCGVAPSPAAPTSSQPTTSEPSNSNPAACPKLQPPATPAPTPDVPPQLGLPNNPRLRITKPEAPFPEPILLTDAESRPTPAEPVTPSSAEPRTYKRSISQQKDGERTQPATAVAALPSPKFRARAIPRPSGLDVKVSKMGPIFLGSPPLSESKKSRSGNSSPCGLLEQLAWGTSHLSVNSPEVRHKNPFEQACARLQEEAEKRAKEEAAATGSSSNSSKIDKTEAVPGIPEPPSPAPVKPDPASAASASATASPADAETMDTSAQVTQAPAQQPQATSSTGIGASAPTPTLPPPKEDGRKCVEVKRRGILKMEGKGKAKGRCKSPRTVSPRPSQSQAQALKQPLPAKLQVNLKPGKEPVAPQAAKAKKVPSPSETSVGFQFGRTRVGKLVDAVLPTSGTKCKTGKAKTKDLPQLMVAKQVHVQLETPSGAKSKNASSTADPMNPFFSRQISSHSQSSDNSSGISPSYESESGSVSLNSPCSAGISPDYSAQTPTLFDSLGHLVRSPLLTEVKSCPTFSTITEGEGVPNQQQQQPQHPNSSSVSSEDAKTNSIWQKRKECGNSAEEPTRPESSAAADRLGGYATAKCGYSTADYTDCDARCARKTPMVVAGRSASCEEISSCAREAVSEIVVRPRRELMDLSSYAGMDGEDDDYDSRSLSSQRSLSSSCEMIEVS